MREAVKRTIYDHWDIFDDGVQEEAKQSLIDNGNEDPSDSEIWDEVYRYDEFNWDEEKYNLKEVFDNGNKFLAVGTCGLWHGNYDDGFMFDSFDQLMENFRDCNLKLWDENGHFFIEGSHHDGTHLVEIKQLTQKGEQYYDNWNWGPSSDTRREFDVYKKLFTDSHYSHLIHYMHRTYDCPKVQYVKKGEN